MDIRSLQVHFFKQLLCITASLTVGSELQFSLTLPFSLTFPTTTLAFPDFEIFQVRGHPAHSKLIYITILMEQ